MFKLSQEELKKLGSAITTAEIFQQPDLWVETVEIFENNKAKINDFMDNISSEGKIRIIFTGAGTSQYVGDTLVPFLNKHGDRKRYVFSCHATTDIVSSPTEFLFEDETIVLVSFARSGNSPESVAAVDIANKYVRNVYHLIITCNSEGKLAKDFVSEEKALVLLMPEKSNDAGFAMTGSFSCMYLMGLLIFDTRSSEEKVKYANSAISLGREALDKEDELEEILSNDFSRIVYLGSGSLGALTREVQLKILELTAGKIATIYDTSMGFRHGPKSFVDDKTLVVGFINNDEYTRQYDIDILNEVYKDDIALNTIGISQKNVNNFGGLTLELTNSDIMLEDGYLVLPFVIIGQTISLLTSVKCGNTPDTPSPTGTVNRVVKGVQIHPFD